MFYTHDRFSFGDVSDLAAEPEKVLVGIYHPPNHGRMAEVRASTFFAV